jgi:predicted small metal-binding protein
MALIINCECGYVIRGQTEAELVRQARAHIASNHPAIATQATDQDYLDMAAVENVSGED